MKTDDLKTLNLDQELFEKGLMAHQKGNLDVAQAIYETILKDNPTHSESCHFLGVVYYQKSQIDKALAYMEQAIKLNKKNPVFYNNICDLYIIKDDLKSAEKCARTAIKLKKKYKDPYIQLGVVLSRKKQYISAATCYRQALKIDPYFAKAHNNLGNVLREIGQEDKALEHYLKAQDSNPHFIQALNNIGLWYADHGETHKAMSYYQQAIDLQPEFSASHINLSMAQLLLGNFEEGWEEYEWRFKTIDNKFKQPSWDGTDFSDQTLLIHTEQGLGDTIQFFRYLPMVQEKGGKIIFQCQKSLHPLLQDYKYFDQIITEEDQAEDFHLHCSLLSLPRIFGTDIDNIPSQKSYINIKKHSQKLPPAANSTKLKVGIVWAGNPDHRNDTYRSMRVKDLQDILKLDDITFYSLQKNLPEDEKNNIFSENFIDCRNIISDFHDTASLIDQCDLIISVDTSVAHVAGAMGKETLLMLPLSTDWRWMLNREDTPWYPSITLFRQETLGDWQPVIQKIYQKLRKRKN